MDVNLIYLDKCAISPTNSNDLIVYDHIMMVKSLRMFGILFVRRKVTDIIDNQIPVHSTSFIIMAIKISAVIK